jgi:hypothetical protein
MEVPRRMHERMEDVIRAKWQSDFTTYVLFIQYMRVLLAFKADIL